MTAAGSKPVPVLVPPASSVKEVVTIIELLRMNRAQERHLHHIHLSASWMSLGRLMSQRSAEQRWLKSNAEVLELLV